ncbi:MAG: hypothetical protein R6V50_03665 [Thermoplasmatota archaeon]
MTNHNIHIVDIPTLVDARKLIQKIGSDPQSIDIMAPKAVFKAVRVHNIILQDAIIIKQDMLSIGGEVAIPQWSFEHHQKSADILIMGTLKQLKELIEKLKRHYPRIKMFSHQLSLIVDEIL